MSNESDDKPPAEKFDAWVRRTPAFIYVVLAALVLGSIFTIADGFDRVRDYYDVHFRWRQAEYEKLESLRAGISITKVEEVLGSPLFVRASEDNTLTEFTFDGRDYWVQAVYDRTGTVVLLAITSCSPLFTPTFRNRIGDVTLNKTRFDFPTSEEPEAYRYYVSGATGNNFFYDQYYGGNPAFYKTYFFGINDACAAETNIVPLQNRLQRLLFAARRDDDGRWEFIPEPESVVNEFRTNSVVNTYAELAYMPLPTRDRDVDDVLRYFQVGADRQLTRQTLEPE